ncbi:MAG: hypothetical protein JNM19_03770 [Chitinophagaceae bacterium]|nr:hypothetical protein [Chitinophagaceae bacterium]
MNTIMKAAGIGLAAAIIAFFAMRVSSKQKSKAVYNGRFIIHTSVAENQTSLRDIKKILEKRLTTGKYTHQINIETENSLRVLVKGIKDTSFIKEILTATARIQFRETFTLRDLVEPFTKALEIEMEQKKALTAPETKTIPQQDSLPKEISSLLDSLDYHEVKSKIDDSNPTGLIDFSYTENSPGSAILGKVRPEDTAAVRQLLMAPAVKALTPANLEYYFGKENYQQTKHKTDIVLYAIKTSGPADNAPLENEELRNASWEFDQFERPAIMLNFTKAGASKWAFLTRKNTGRCIAIIFDNMVISAPQVESEIPGGNAKISGNFTMEECQAMAEMLNTDPLPFRLAIRSASFSRASPPFNFRVLLAPLLAFLLFSGLGYFIIKTLKST